MLRFSVAVLAFVPKSKFYHLRYGLIYTALMKMLINSGNISHS